MSELKALKWNWKKGHHLINIDWLQMSANCPLNLEEFESDEYELERRAISGAFKNCVEVKKDGATLAVISYENRIEGMDKELVIVKLANQVLYTQDRKKVFERICKHFRLQIKGVTRVDISCDLKKFHNGRDVMGFLKEYAQEKWIKKGRANCSPYHGSGRYRQYWAYTFGSANSKQRYYIYNKSKELRDKSEKPYIRKWWQKNGLTDAAEDVWRVEFSLKADRAEWFDKYFAQIGANSNDQFHPATFHKLDWFNEANYYPVFYGLMSRYLSFVKNTGCKNHRRLKPVKLINPYADPVFKAPQEVRPDVNRMNKINLKWLKELNDSQRETDPVLAQATAKIINSEIIKHGLEHWALHKLGIDVSENSS